MCFPLEHNTEGFSTSLSLFLPKVPWEDRGQDGGGLNSTASSVLGQKLLDVTCALEEGNTRDCYSGLVRGPGML